MLRLGTEQKQGVLLAGFVAVVLAAARWIEVSKLGPAMSLFGACYLLALLFSSFLRPHWYLLLVIAYLPFSRIYPLSLLVDGLNMVNVILVLGGVAWLVSRRRRRGRRRIGLTEPLVGLYTLMGLISLIPSSISGIAPMELLRDYRTWVAPILLFFIARALVRNREHAAAILKVLAWTVLLVAVLTWKEGLDRGGRGSIDSERVPGLLEQANMMGAFLAYYGVSLLGLGLTARSWSQRLPYLGAFLVSARAILFTFSRGAYLAIAGGAATAMALAQPLLFVAAAVGALIAPAIYPPLLPDAVRDRLDPAVFQGSFDSLGAPGEGLDASSAMRLALWDGAFALIGANPVFGVGLARFESRIDDYTSIQLDRDDPRDAHNAFLLTASEMGLPALAVLLALLTAWALKALALRFRRRDPFDRQLGVIFLGSLSAVIISCMLGSRFSQEALIGYFWILAALVVVVSRLRDEPSLGRRR